MASDKNFVEYIVGQIENADEISCKKMFGEYAMYSDRKVVALICDNQVFIKPTKSGRAYIGEVVEKPPYPGAKPYFLIETGYEDQEMIFLASRSTSYTTR